MSALRLKSTRAGTSANSTTRTFDFETQHYSTSRMAHDFAFEYLIPGTRLQYPKTIDEKKTCSKLYATTFKKFRVLTRMVVDGVDDKTVAHTSGCERSIADPCDKRKTLAALLVA